MKKILLLILIILANKSILAKDITVIELHNKSVDEILLDSLSSSEEDNSLIIEENIESTESIVNEINSSNENNNLENESNLNEIDSNLDTIEVIETLYFWQDIKKEDLIFLTKNIDEINSLVLKNELLTHLEPSDDLPEEFVKEDFDRLLINTLLNLGDRKKSYQIIQNLGNITKNENNLFYKKFEINYLLSNYNLSEACDYRNQINDLNLINEDIFFLKVDIFCLSLQEKFDEANLLFSLLIESGERKDEYFQNLYNFLINQDDFTKIQINSPIDDINENNIFLYSAMHRIRNMPLSDIFLAIDPINLSMPIILSSSTDIKLRLKAAHLAFLNNLINIESVAALYRAADFTYDELNDQSKIKSLSNSDSEIGMAYFYQLINIQLLPITRLEAIIKFWNFAEKNNLELIAYALSLQSLNSIEPSNELAIYGPKIAKAYIYNNDFINAEKWLLFSDSSSLDGRFKYELNSSKLLYNLFNINESDSFTNVLFDNLQYMNKDLIDENNPDYNFKNEILNIIFSTLNNKIQNPFLIEKKINEDRLMPSMFITSMIRNAAKSNKQSELLFSMAASLNGKKWQDIHPEHFRLILIGLKEYNSGSILNNILIEILRQCKII